MTEVLETGHIFFLYRPRVEREEAHGLDDVQRFFIMLRPRGRPVWRLLAVGRKRLPRVNNGAERVWAFVDKVGTKPQELEDELDRRRYQTKTRGERLLPEARPAGVGVYALVSHDGHTHLAYELQLPREPGPVQQELNIEPRASYIVTVRNPDAPAPPAAGFGPRQEIHLPAKLQQRFRGRRFAELIPEFLDHEGVELVVVGAGKDPEEELGVKLEPQDEREAEAAIFKDLHLERTQHPLEPLFKGEWR
jgi:hypothetical protein